MNSKKHRCLIIITTTLLSVLSIAAEQSTDTDSRRQQFRKNQQERVQNNARRKQFLQNADIHKDLVYGDEHPSSQSLDLYVPKDTTQALPLVVWIHGGGWRNGDKAACPVLLLLEHGFAVASINYRLTDIAIFPAQIHDCKAAIRYLRANAKTYSIDPNHIGVGGGSAGGHLVALLGTTNGNKDLEGKVGKYPDTSSNVQAVCDWFGPTDFFTMPIGKRQAIKDGRDPELALFGGSISEKRELVEKACPALHVSNNAPPFLIMHGDSDNLVPVQQSQLLHDKLKAAGVDSTLIVLEGKGHGFRNDPKVLEPVIEFFNRTLKDEKPKPEKQN